MRNAMHRQSELGWHLVFSGLLDDTWHYKQEQYYRQKETRRSQNTGMLWNIKICTWMIREARQMWLTRNDEVHQLDDGNSKAEQAIFEQIRRLYELKDEIGHQDKILLDEPLDDKLKRPIPILQQWIRNIVPVLNRCRKDFQLKLKTGQRDIRH